MPRDSCVHDTSLPFDKCQLSRQISIGNVSAAIKSYHWGCSSSFFSLQRFNLSPNTTTFDTSSTPTPVNSISIIFMFSFFSTPGIPQVCFNCRNFLLLRILLLHLLLVSCFDICTRITHWLDVITNGCHISIQSCHWTYERTALPYSFPDYPSQNNARHRSHCWVLQTSLIGSSRN